MHTHLEKFIEENGNEKMLEMVLMCRRSIVKTLPQAVMDWDGEEIRDRLEQLDMMETAIRNDIAAGLEIEQVNFYNNSKKLANEAVEAAN